MAIAERITRYSVSVMQTSYVDYTRTVRLELESGTTVFIGFPDTRPPDWLQFGTGTITIYLPVDQFDDVYQVLRTACPAFCTAIDLFGLQIGSVHTELDLSVGQPTSAAYQEQSLEAVIVRALAEH